MILQIGKAEDGDLRGVVYLIDDSPNGFVLPLVSQNGSALSFELPELKLSYKGIVSSDSASISGTVTWEGKAKATFRRTAAGTAWPHDIHCACTTSFLAVTKGVNLEVLDWGGTGRPLILLAGLGNTAHVFDDFAHKLVPRYHVYGITRRGVGESSQPPPTDANYNADRLGDDVAAVIESLHLQQPPVLVGHSIAGEELSSVGSRFPDKVAGLVYLDAAYGYAFYDPAFPDFMIDTLSIRKRLDDTIIGDQQKAMADLLASLPDFEKKLRAQQRIWADVPADPSNSGAYGQAEAMKLGQRKYTEINVPVLAIFANPHKSGPTPGMSDAGSTALARVLQDYTETAINALTAGLPAAHIVSIANADHNIFRSNEADVLREMDSFLTKLPPSTAPHAQSAGPSR